MGAAFRLVPRSSLLYRPRPIELMSLSAPFEAMAKRHLDLQLEVPPNSFVSTATREMGVYTWLVWERIDNSTDDGTEMKYNLASDWGGRTALMELCFYVQDVMDSMLTTRLYELFWSFCTLQGNTFVMSLFRPSQSLSQVSSIHENVHFKHQEWEIFVPVTLVLEFSRWLQNALQSPDLWLLEKSFWTLRYVYGCDSLTSANGVRADGLITDVQVIAFNVDCYSRSYWGVFND